MSLMTRLLHWSCWEPEASLCLLCCSVCFCFICVLNLLFRHHSRCGVVDPTMKPYQHGQLGFMAQFVFCFFFTNMRRWVSFSTVMMVFKWISSASVESIWTVWNVSSGLLSVVIDPNWRVARCEVFYRTWLKRQSQSKCLKSLNWIPRFFYFFLNCICKAAFSTNALLATPPFFCTAAIGGSFVCLHHQYHSPSILVLKKHTTFFFR